MGDDVDNTVATSLVLHLLAVLPMMTVASKKQNNKTTTMMHSLLRLCVTLSLLGWMSLNDDILPSSVDFFSCVSVAAEQLDGTENKNNENNNNNNISNNNNEKKTTTSSSSSSD